MDNEQVCAVLNGIAAKRGYEDRHLADAVGAVSALNDAPVPSMKMLRKSVLIPPYSAWDAKAQMTNWVMKYQRLHPGLSEQQAVAKLMDQYPLLAEFEAHATEDVHKDYLSEWLAMDARREQAEAADTSVRKRLERYMEGEVRKVVERDGCDEAKGWEIYLADPDSDARQVYEAYASTRASGKNAEEFVKTLERVDKRRARIVKKALRI